MKIDFPNAEEESGRIDGRVTFYLKITDGTNQAYQAVFGADSRLIKLEDIKDDAPFSITEGALYRRVFCVGFITDYEEQILALPGEKYFSNRRIVLRSSEDLHGINDYLTNYFVNYINRYFVSINEETISLEDLFDYDAFMEDDLRDESGESDLEDYSEDNGDNLDESSSKSGKPKYLGPIPEPTEDNMKDIYDNL